MARPGAGVGGGVRSDVALQVDLASGLSIVGTGYQTGSLFATLYHEVSWDTIANWPVALPGTAVGTIPII